MQSGFCRTGKMFASEYWKEAGCAPDILATAKSIAAGLPLSAVIAREEIMEKVTPGIIGGTYCGNPLACAVALKGIEIFERDDYMSKIRHIEQISRQEMGNFSDLRIKEVRIMGGCTCVEVHNPKTLEGFQQFAYERGVFCRPFLNYMYSMVPYVISDEELIQIFDVMKDWFH